MQAERVEHLVELLAQRRRLDHVGAETIVEVGAKPAVVDLRAQVAACAKGADELLMGGDGLTQATGAAILAAVGSGVHGSVRDAVASFVECVTGSVRYFSTIASSSA